MPERRGSGRSICTRRATPSRGWLPSGRAPSDRPEDALGHRHAATTRVYVESIAVKKDKYSQYILEALELPDFEIDLSWDPWQDGANDKAVDRKPLRSDQ